MHYPYVLKLKYPPDMFDDADRITIHSSGFASTPLRFSINYDTECGISEPLPTESPKQMEPESEIKTVSLMEYLLGWY